MDLKETCRDKSESLLLDLCTKHGFLASKTKKDNYQRIFSRDGIIMGIASTYTNNKKLIECFESTLKTLKKYQSENGTIPSNVDPYTGNVSYGGTTGRVDATLWYIIGVYEYFKYTKNHKFLDSFFLSVEKSIKLLSCWEFNNKHLIYVPRSGDWADEYIQDGYVLYDQVLYSLALSSFHKLIKIRNKTNSKLNNKIETLNKIININFWPSAENKNSVFVYHRTLYKSLLKNKKNYFITCFGPGKVLNTFNSFGNSLTILSKISNPEQTKKVLSIGFNKYKKFGLLPAFAPTITQKDYLWNNLKDNFSFRFKNYPGRFHNGGLWILTTSFFSIACYTNNEKKMALELLDNMCVKCSKMNWGFYEFFDGNTGKPGGTKFLGMNAAGYILAHEIIINNGGVLFDE